MNILGLDYGTKRIGVALAATSLAEPLTIIPNNSHAFKTIKSLVNHQQIDLVIIGLSEGNMAQKTRNFADQLQPIINVPIKFFDETLTSQETSLKLLHLRRRARSLPQDAYQAALILQRFLDSQANMLE